MIAFWKSLSRAAQIGFIAGLVLIAALTAFATWWTLRTDYQVLFSDLKPQDAQAMTAELDRLKTPYKLSDVGATILVDGATVHATRIKLMGKDLPLHGAVGFELFNNTDFGMTEFAQKINYQRALQGEITRTIQSLAEIREVRVLLALPEQGLFKQANSKAKASITIGLKPGQSLRANQVAGIQRLVAASVPGMTMQDVTIVDNQGVALTRLAADAENDASSGRLELKREMETYLSQKVTAVLDKAFGAGQSLASVDVVLNMEQIKTTTEDVLPASTRANGQSAGVVIREREVTRDQAATADARSTLAGGAAQSAGGQREVEYAVGRRVEQVITQPGSVRRLHVVAVVRKSLDAGDEERIRNLVAAAVGVSIDRGDSVVVQSLGKATVLPAASALAGAEGNADASVDASATALDSAAQTQTQTPAASPRGHPTQRHVILGLAAVLMAAAFAAWLWARRRPILGRIDETTGRVEPATALSEQEREAALSKVKKWLHREEATPHNAAGARP